MANLWNNDEAKAFFIANGYPANYNDGMLAWLRDYFGVTGLTLPDLLHRYLVDHGPTMVPVGTIGFLLKEDSFYLLLETGDKIILEA